MERDGRSEVLIVDDDRGARESTEGLLKEEFRVLLAADSSEAFDKLKLHAVDVVLLDIGLPDLDGREVLKRIKAAWPKVEVIMVSASKDLDAVVDCFEDGAFDFIVKPFRAGLLVAQVRQAVERIGLRMSVHALTAKLVERQPPVVSVFGQILRRLDDGSMDLPELTAQVEKMLIERALRRAEGNKALAAKGLGISEASLTSAIAVLGVSQTGAKVI